MLKLEETKEVYQIPAKDFTNSDYLREFTKRDVETKEISLKDVKYRFRTVVDLLDQIRMFEFTGKVEITRYAIAEYNDGGCFETCEILGWNYKCLN